MERRTDRGTFKNIRVALATALAASVLTVAPLASETTAPTAEAAWPCRNLGVCGVVWNQYNSTCYLRVSNNWSNGHLAGTIRRIAPNSGDPFKDADGFRAVSGCKSKHSFNGGLTWSSWTTKPVKVNDVTTALVRTIRR